MPGRRRDFGWVRDEQNPVIPVQPGTWKEIHTANPDLLPLGDTYFLYFRGQQGGHDRIGVATIPINQFDGKRWEEYPGNPVIDVGAPGEFDCDHVLDPGTVCVDGTIYLYYTAHGKQGFSTGLATSQDGVRFEKQGKVLAGGAPEVVYRDGVFYLFFSRNNGKGGWDSYVAISEDGRRFSEYKGNPILVPGAPGQWDSRSVVTPRIFPEGNTYYMVYGGSAQYHDYPSYFGVSVSEDLLHWTKYTGNPVYERGQAGEWDEGGIWFGTVHRHGDTYYMWYEGFGGGKSHTEDYGAGGKSQIGLATLTRKEGFLG